MPNPFLAADFSGIAEGSGLAIATAIHHATIAVDEKGTEATAATIIAMEESAMPPAELTLDRPFIFAIVDRESGDLLGLRERPRIPHGPVRREQDVTRA